jgi:hypothetical protein
MPPCVDSCGGRTDRVTVDARGETSEDSCTLHGRVGREQALLWVNEIDDSERTVYLRPDSKYAAGVATGEFKKIVKNKELAQRVQQVSRDSKIAHISPWNQS